MQPERADMNAWIEHDGGKCPVDLETRVIVKHRSGETSDSYINNERYGGDNRAGGWGWVRNGDPGDIMAYRVIDETWRRVPSFPDYIVSDAGRVRHRRVGAPILRGSLDKDGYRRVGLNGCTLRVHAIVCETFHGPRPDGMECAHIDGDKLNNSAGNLRWATSAENTADTVRMGRFRRPKGHERGELHPAAKLSDVEVERLRALATEGWSQRKIAARFGITQPHVSRLVNGLKRAQDIAQGPSQ